MPASVAKVATSRLDFTSPSDPVPAAAPAGIDESHPYVPNPLRAPLAPSRMQASAPKPEDAKSRLEHIILNQGKSEADRFLRNLEQDVEAAGRRVGAIGRPAAGVVTGPSAPVATGTPSAGVPQTRGEREVLRAEYEQKQATLERYRAAYRRLNVVPDRAAIAASKVVTKTLAVSRVRTKLEAKRYDDSAETQSLANAAIAIHAKYMEAEAAHRALMAQHSNARALSSPELQRGAAMVQEAAEARARAEAYQAEWARAHPVLARLTPDALAIVAKGASPEASKIIQNAVAETLEAIEEMEARIAADPHHALKFPAALHVAKEMLGIEAGTPQDILLEAHFVETGNHVLENDLIWAAVSIGVGLVAAIPTGGASLALATGMLAVANAVDVYREYDAWSAQHAAANTDLQKDASLSQEDPSAIGLVLAVTAASVDAAGTARLIRALGAFKRLPNQLGAIAEATLKGAHGPRLQNLAQSFSASERKLLAKAIVAKNANDPDAVAKLLTTLPKKKQAAAKLFMVHAAGDLAPAVANDLLTSLTPDQALHLLDLLGAKAVHRQLRTATVPQLQALETRLGAEVLAAIGGTMDHARILHLERELGTEPFRRLALGLEGRLTTLATELGIENLRALDQGMDAARIPSLVKTLGASALQRHLKSSSVDDIIRNHWVPQAFDFAKIRANPNVTAAQADDLQGTLSYIIRRSDIDQDDVGAVAAQFRKTNKGHDVAGPLAELHRARQVHAQALHAEGTIIRLGVKTAQNGKVDLGRGFIADFTQPGIMDEADVLYAGKDGKIHVEEVKATATALVSKVGEGTDPNEYLARFADWKSAGSNHEATIVVASEAEWTAVFSQVERKEVLLRVADNRIRLEVGGVGLTPAKTQTLFAKLDMQALKHGLTSFAELKPHIRTIKAALSFVGMRP